jgi:hypothetical protein
MYASLELLSIDYPSYLTRPNTSRGDGVKSVLDSAEFVDVVV